MSVGAGERVKATRSPTELRLRPNARTSDGADVRLLSAEPFRIEHSTGPGHPWIAAMHPDGVVRPVRADRVKWL